MEKQAIDKVSSFKVLIGELNKCTDFRNPNKIDYPLVEILFLVFCSLLCGCKTYDDIVDFGEMKLAWLSNFLAYENGIPSHDTIGRVLGFISTKQLEKALSSFSSYGLQLANGTVIHIDGKKISRSATAKEQQTKLSAGGKQAVNMVNVYCSAIDSCLASIRVVNKSSEKQAVPTILEMLDLSHCLLTFDAGYCYTDVVEKVIDADADYLIGLKNNQPKLYQAATTLLENSDLVEVDQEEEEDSHGRLEQRTCSVLHINDLEKEQYQQYEEVFARWLQLLCLIKVVCHKTIKASGKTSIETRYYISSSALTAKQANKDVRGHWSVENNLHWVLDAILREDDSRKRSNNSAANFSILTKLALNKIKAFDDPKTSTNRKMRKCAMSQQYLEKVAGIC